jgi:hypothetical protein
MWRRDISVICQVAPIDSLWVISEVELENMYRGSFQILVVQKWIAHDPIIWTFIEGRDKELSDGILLVPNIILFTWGQGVKSDQFNMAAYGTWIYSNHTLRENEGYYFCNMQMSHKS